MALVSCCCLNNRPVTLLCWPICKLIAFVAICFWQCFCFCCRRSDDDKWIRRNNKAAIWKTKTVQTLPKKRRPQCCMWGGNWLWPGLAKDGGPMMITAPKKPRIVCKGILSWSAICREKLVVNEIRFSVSLLLEWRLLNRNIIVRFKNIYILVVFLSWGRLV